MESAIRNPYVGPRPMRRGEPIFGREREITELDRLLNAERIVLFYAPSGAGKTSLVNAGLLPRLDWRQALEHGLPTDGKFDVWSPTRVNLQVPEGLPVRNRFVWSAAMGLEEELPDAMRRQAEDLAPLSLAESVSSRRRRKGAPPEILLVFDQLEELIRVDPFGIPEKQDFFDQLGELLRDPMIWALLVLREDYLAPLDPYCRRVPTHLKNRYRIDRLSLRGAIQAVAGPTDRTARRYAAGVVERLVDDLAQVQVQAPDGSFSQQTGIYVEPMHLQVVCTGLWDRLSAKDTVIDQKDLAFLGDVGEALGRYYEDAIRRVAGGGFATERRIREWFGTRLITADGVRSQVLKGAGESEGLGNDLIDALLDTYLIRAEQRAGATWYELAHDRLVEPVRERNADWVEASLSLFQQRARLWNLGDRPDGLLLTGDEELRQALAWTRDNLDDLTDAERVFLERSLESAETARKAASRIRWIKRLAVAATSVSVVAVVALVFAWLNKLEADSQRTEAIHQAERARRGLMNAQLARGREVLQRNPSAAREWLLDDARFPPDLRAGNAIWLALDARAATTNPTSREITPSNLDISGFSGVAVSPDGDRVAVVEQGGTIRQWRLPDWTPQDSGFRPEGHPTGIAFTPDGRGLVTATTEGSALAWYPGSPLPKWRWEDQRGPEIVGGGAPVVGGRRFMESTPESSGMLPPVILQDKTLIVGGGPREIALVDIDTGTTIRTLAGTESARAMCPTPDGRLLAVADQAGAITIWNIETGQISALLSRSLGPVSGLVYSPTGSTLAIAIGDTVDLIDATDSSHIARLSSGSEVVNRLVFSPDGQMVVTGDRRGDLLIWNANGGELWGVLRGHRHAIGGLAFAGGQNTLVSADAEGKLRTWELKRPRSRSGSLGGHGGPVYGLAFNRDGRRLASASWDGNLRLWDIDTGRQVVAPIRADIFAAYAIAYSRGREKFAVAGRDGAIKVVDPASWSVIDRLARHDTTVTALEFNDNGSVIASADVKGHVWVTRLDGDQDSILLDHDGKRVAELAFSASSNVLATACWDGRLRLWNPSNGRLLSVFDAGLGRLESVAFSPDESTIAAGAWNGRISLWDLDSGTELLSLEGHTDLVTALAFSPNGASLGSASEDGTALIWDLAAHRPVLTLTGHTDAVEDLAFSPDGLLIATAGWDRTVRLWHTDGAHYDFETGRSPGRVTEDQLVAMGVASDQAKLWVDRLNLAMVRFEINSPLRRAHFLTHILKESGNLRYTSERLDYSAQALRRIFNRQFRSEAVASDYAKDPERIANRAYANRLGNGDEASGDGWRYRGRGLILLTGKSNYRALGQNLGVDLLGLPDLVATIHGADSAGFFWYSAGLNASADRDDLSGTTRRLTGGYRDVKERKAILARVKAALGLASVQ